MRASPPSTVVSACESSSKLVSKILLDASFAIQTNGRVKRTVRTGAIHLDSRVKHESESPKGGQFLSFFPCLRASTGFPLLGFLDENNCFGDLVLHVLMPFLKAIIVNGLFDQPHTVNCDVTNFFFNCKYKPLNFGYLVNLVM